MELKFISLLIGQIFDQVMNFNTRQYFGCNFILNILQSILYHNLIFYIIINHFPSKYMSKTLPKTLTPNGVSKMFQASSESENVIVQITNISQKQNFYSCIVSDGLYTIKAIIPLELNINKEKDLNSIMKIKSHMSNAKGIVVEKFEKLKDYEKQIGTPIDFLYAKENNIQNICSNIIETQVKDQHIEKTVKKEPVVESIKIFPQHQHINKKNIEESSNETVSSLYVGVSNWMIVCRLLKCDYKEYENKKKMLTKQLNVQLIDRSNMKINGKFFGESSLKFKDYLKQNSVYQISKGRVVEGNYNDSKNKIYSPYQILFNDNSSFNQISDVNLIAKSQNLIKELANIVEDRVFNHQLDVVAILIEIQGEVELPKKNNSGMVRKRNLVICDPEKQISMFATIWGNNVTIDPSLVGKTVVLSHFKLNEYLESLSLNSSPKSTIKALPNHRYSKLQGKINTQNYQMISKNRKDNDAQSGDICHNIRDLEAKINLMGSGEIVISQLDLYVSRLATHRKWTYDGCNKCSKSVQPMSKCQKCNIIVEVPSPHFSIGVQFSDPYGSLWTTALDELGLRIFDVSINYLKTLNEDELGNQADKYLFKEFKLKIKTTKDEENRVKHQVSRINDLSYTKISKNILEQIKSIM